MTEPIILDEEIKDVTSFLDQMIESWERLAKESEKLPKPPEYIK